MNKLILFFVLFVCLFVLFYINFNNLSTLPAGFGSKEMVVEEFSLFNTPYLVNPNNMFEAKELVIVDINTHKA